MRYESRRIKLRVILCRVPFRFGTWHLTFVTSCYLFYSCFFLLGHLDVWYLKSLAFYTLRCSPSTLRHSGSTLRCSGSTPGCSVSTPGCSESTPVRRSASTTRHSASTMCCGSTLPLSAPLCPPVVSHPHAQLTVAYTMQQAIVAHFTALSHLLASRQVVNSKRNQALTQAPLEGER